MRRASPVYQVIPGLQDRTDDQGPQDHKVLKETQVSPEVQGLQGSQGPKAAWGRWVSLDPGGPREVQGSLDGLARTDNQEHQGSPEPRETPAYLGWGRLEQLD